jgi:hypothetical protein
VQIENQSKIQSHPREFINCFSGTGTGTPPGHAAFVPEYPNFVRPSTGAGDGKLPNADQFITNARCWRRRLRRSSLGPFASLVGNYACVGRFIAGCAHIPALAHSPRRGCLVGSVPIEQLRRIPCHQLACKQTSILTCEGGAVSDLAGELRVLITGPASI